MRNLFANYLGNVSVLDGNFFEDFKWIGVPPNSRLV